MVAHRVLLFLGGLCAVLGDEVTSEEAADESGPYTPPAYSGADASSAFVETFTTDPFDEGRWKLSTDSRYAGQDHAVKFEVSDTAAGKFTTDQGLLLAAPAKTYGVGAAFDTAISNADEDAFVAQYEVKFHNGLECGGAYIKLLRDEGKPIDIENMGERTPFSVMFGPDKCGNTNKVHLIIQQYIPVTDKWVEHHLSAPPAIKTDMKPHLYAVVIKRASKTYEIFIDGSSVKAGSLDTDFSPPFQPPTEIDDPEDFKPDDWVDEAQIPDPDATKPDDWDEDAPREIPDADAEKPSGWLDDEADYIADPSAEMPEDWDEEDDGEWEAPQIKNPACEGAAGCGEWKRPMIANPEYKGKWSAPLIDNPEYIGEWSPRQIKNPDYFEAENVGAVAAVGGVAVEVWTMQGGLHFDNFVVGNDLDAVQMFGEATWRPRFDAEAVSADELRARKRAREREAILAEGGALAYPRYAWALVVDTLLGYPVVSAVLFVVFLVGLIFYCMRDDEAEYIQNSEPAPRSSTATASINEDDDEQDDDSAGDEDAGEGEGETEEDSAKPTEAKTASSDSGKKSGGRAENNGVRQRKKRGAKRTSD